MMAVPNTEGLARLRVPVASVADGLDSLATQIDDRLKGLAEEGSATVRTEATELSGRLADVAAVLQRDLGRAELDQNHAGWLVAAGCRLLPDVEMIMATIEREQSGASSAIVGDLIDQCRVAFDEIEAICIPPAGADQAGTHGPEAEPEVDQRLLAALSAIRNAFTEDDVPQPTETSAVNTPVTANAPVTPSAPRPASTPATAGAPRPASAPPRASSAMAVAGTLPARFFAGVVGEELSLIDPEGRAAGSVRLVAATSVEGSTCYEYTVDRLDEPGTWAAAQLDVPLVSPITLLANRKQSQGGSDVVLRDAEGVEVTLDDVATDQA